MQYSGQPVLIAVQLLQCLSFAPLIVKLTFAAAIKMDGRAGEGSAILLEQSKS